MDQKIKVSVIIPAYNVSDYIKKCVESVLNQSYKNIEIIITNDGSTDDTLSKINEIISENPSADIKVIDKENGGLSMARNDAIKIAEGEYISFIDSDDFIVSSEAFEKMVLATKNSAVDLVVFNTLKYYQKSDTSINNSLFPTASEDKYALYLKMIEASNFPISAWGKLIRKSIILENDLFFEPGVYSEDISWSLALYDLVDKTSFINEYLYSYLYDRSGSISNTFKNKNVDDLFKIIKYWTAKEEFSSEEYKNVVLNFIAYEYIVLLGISTSRNTSKSQLKEIKEYKWLLDYNTNSKVRKIGKLSKIIGYNLTKKMLETYVKNKK